MRTTPVLPYLSTPKLSRFTSNFELLLTFAEMNNWDVFKSSRLILPWIEALHSEGSRQGEESVSIRSKNGGLSPCGIFFAHEVLTPLLISPLSLIIKGLERDSFDSIIHTVHSFRTGNPPRSLDKLTGLENGRRASLCPRHHKEMRSCSGRSCSRCVSNSFGVALLLDKRL